MAGQVPLKQQQLPSDRQQRLRHLDSLGLPPLSDRQLPMHLAGQRAHFKHQVPSGTLAHLDNSLQHFEVVQHLLAQLLASVVPPPAVSELKQTMPFLQQATLAVYPSSLTPRSKHRYSYTTLQNLNGATTLLRTSQVSKRPIHSRLKSSLRSQK